MKSVVTNEDCMDLMARYPDKYFDLAIVDPPYGINGNSHRKNMSRNKFTLAKVYHSALWDQQRPSQEYFNELFRVSKNQIIWGINYFELCIDMGLQGGRLIWDKVNGANNFSDGEIAYCSYINSVRIFPFMWNGMQQGLSMKDGKTLNAHKSLNEKRIHPTQKPVELYKWCFSKFTHSGQKVLDTHLGSGSSRIAAVLCDLEFVGCEIDHTYFNDQEKRYCQFISQQRLFTEMEVSK